MTKKHHILLYSLLALCVVLAVAYAVSAERESRRYAGVLEDAYQGALMSAMMQMEEMRLNIDKALVSADRGQSAALISRISSDASAVQGGLSSLPLAHSAMGDAVKLCNQLSDYAASLLSKGEGALSADDAQTLSELSSACDALLSALRRAYKQMRTGNLTFSSLDAYMRDADQAARPLESVAESIDYPTLIYDGPFSDVVSEDAPRGLGEEEITAADALRIAAEFTGAPLESAALTQESGGLIPAFGVKVTLSDCVLQLAVTRQGGQILWMFPENAAFDVQYGLEESKQAAQAFFAAHGFGEMRLTFWQIYGGMATLSYAAVQDGALLYPDLIKVQLRLDTLAVVGWEARHYLSSHTPRAGLAPAVSQEEAQGAVSERLRVTAAQLCLIPQNRREVLCWEFTGEYNGHTYYVFIDAATGRQADIQRLVDGENGPKAS